MHTNRPNCTIYEKTVQNRSPTYVRHELPCVYWEQTNAFEILQNNSISRSPDNLILCVIPKESLQYFPKTDDKIVDFLCENAQPPAEALTITSVKNFLDGSLPMQHIEVTAK